MQATQFKRPALILTLLTAGVALAATGDRILSFSEGSTFEGNLRNGPYTYSGKAGAMVKATVSTLTISAPKAVMAAPAGTPITDAKGKRTADFTGGVQVSRGRLTAKGGSLSYAESTGQGVLKDNPSAVFVPAKKDDGDPVNISAQSMSLDVDTNVSTSTGAVKLTTGTQSGASDKLVFDESAEIGLLTGNVKMNRAASANQKELNMVGQEARILTKGKTMYVKGGVKLVQGSVTTTGNELYYDDKKNVAVVVGNALSVDTKNNTKVTGAALEQRTDLGRVRQLSGGYKIPAEQFKLSTEK